MVLIFVALTLVGLLLFAALAVDLSYAREERRQAQNAADAAALAAADALPSFTNAVTAAKNYAWSDFGTDPATGWSGCTDSGALIYRPDPGDGCISFDSSIVPTEARVRIPVRNFNTFFARVGGFSSVAVSAVAVAYHVGGTPCEVCVMAPSGLTFLGNGQGSLSAVNAAVIVNSTSNPAAKLTGSGSLTSTVSIGGPAAPGGFTSTGSGSYQPSPVQHSPIADPLASLTPCPAASPCPTQTGSSGGKVKLTGGASATIDPGIYTSISDQSSGTLTMNPGTYVITGSFSLTGNGAVNATGTTVYLACSNYPTPCPAGTAGASYSLTGTALLTISPPTSGPFQGLSVFADRNNTGALSMSGTGSSFSGTVYALAGSLRLSGNGSWTLTSMLVTASATMTGQGSVTVVWNQAVNVPVTAGTWLVG